MIGPTQVQCLAMVTHENDYRLCWLFREYLDIPWVLAHPLSLERKDRPICEFSRFSHSGLFTLIANKCENGILLEKHRAVDYLMLIEQEISSDEISELIKKIKTLPNMSTAYILPMDRSILSILNMV